MGRLVKLDATVALELVSVVPVVPTGLPMVRITVSFDSMVVSPTTENLAVPDMLPGAIVMDADASL